jgi:pimeloyl-ACP methyl ester carboxylesterase
MFPPLTTMNAGNPVIVYLPDIDGSGAMATTFLSRAQPIFPLTQLIYPGHSRVTLDEMAQGCVTALTEQHQTGAIWLGDSFGSAVALTIALRFPEVTRGLILAGGFSKGPSPFKMLMAAKVWDHTPTKWRKSLVRRQLEHLAKQYPDRISKSSADEVVFNGHLDHVSWRLRLLSAFNLREQLPQLQVPVLYLGGEQDRIVNTHEETRILREAVPDSRTFLFPGCGHLVLAERPDECLEVIHHFIPLAKRSVAA